MNGEHAPPGLSSSTADAMQPDEPRRPLKRQRVSQACSTCRDRKTRCDGRQPVCVACEQRGVASTCRFDQIRRPRSLRPPFSSPYTPVKRQSSSRPETTEPNAHSDAAQALSDLGRAHPSGRHSLLAPAPAPASAPARDSSHGSAYQPDGTPAGHASEAHANGAWAAAKPDGLATIAAENDDSMYGPSSTVALLRHVLPGQSQPKSASPGQRNGSILRPKISRLPDRLPIKTDGLDVLPRRSHADDFVFCFWEFVHPLFPVLHRPSFMHRYDRLWTGAEAHPGIGLEADEAIFSATLNLVFGLGCKFSNLIEPNRKASVGDEFYQRSRQSYPYDILDSTTTDLIQMLVLTGVYLQSTERANRCWNSVGLAIRMAQSLGLHVDPGSAESRSQLDLQMRRRIWHTCIHLDRLLSMTFGRPSMIDQKTGVPVPDLIDDEYLSQQLGREGTQPDGVPSRLGLFISSCKLFVILEEILDLFNRDASGGSSKRQANGATEASQLLQPVLDLNRRLDEFVETVPDYLRAPEPGTPSNTSQNYVHLQQQVLYCRFLYVRLLSLRPLLLLSTRRDLRPASGPSLDDEVIRNCCRRCVFNASQLISTLHVNLGTLYRSSGWHTVYFAFTSAIVLLASFKLDDSEAQLPRTDAESSFDKCFMILDHYQDQIQSARLASRILREMKKRTSHISHPQAKQGQSLSSEPEAAPANGLQYPILDAEMYPPPNFQDVDLSDAWYTQSLVNLDWLDFPQLFS